MFSNQRANCATSASQYTATCVFSREIRPFSGYCRIHSLGKWSPVRANWRIDAAQPNAMPRRLAASFCRHRQAIAAQLAAAPSLIKWTPDLHRRPAQSVAARIRCCLTGAAIARAVLHDGRSPSATFDFSCRKIFLKFGKTRSIPWLSELCLSMTRFTWQECSQCSPRQAGVFSAPPADQHERMFLLFCVCDLLRSCNKPPALPARTPFRQRQLCKRLEASRPDASKSEE